MYVDEKKQGEIQQAPAKVLKLSEAIRIGCAFVTEGRLFSGCAIGTGYQALTGKDLSEAWREVKYEGDCVDLVAEAFGIPKDIAGTASYNHYTDAMSREQVADWLESKGY